MSKTLTILVAHGSSDPDWSNAFDSMTKDARNEIPDSCLAFMELSSPSIDDVVIAAHEKGYQEFKVLPLFLAKGRHLKKDIPAILKNLELKLDIKTELLEPIGSQPEIAKAILDTVKRLTD